MALGPLSEDDYDHPDPEWQTYRRARDHGNLYLRKRGRACAHLGADHRCTLYDRRPAMCRSWSCDPAALSEQYGDLPPERLRRLRQELVRARRRLAARGKET